jgi:hypothetical protein
VPPLRFHGTGECNDGVGLKQTARSCLCRAFIEAPRCRPYNEWANRTVRKADFTNKRETRSSQSKSSKSRYNSPMKFANFEITSAFRRLAALRIEEAMKQ